MRNLSVIILVAVAVSCRQMPAIIPQPAELKMGKGVCRDCGSVTYRIDPSLAEEAYSLEVRKDGITVCGGSDIGLFYAGQTMSFLKRQYKDRMPCLIINDEPRFFWRGIHIDVSRHFFDADFIKKQLRAMARLKLNVLHWHLTDGVAWRMPLDSHPAVVATQHYTKEDIREVIALADSLHITVVPEIEMFGHSEEVVDAIPDIACLYPDGSRGRQLCLGNEETFRFLEDALAEVLDLFPSQLIHVGGDEADYSIWERCGRCASAMEAGNMKDIRELQSRGFGRIASFLREHGRSMIGWDEILDGEIPSDAVIMSWRGVSGGARAASMGHRAVMCPGAHCYLDAYQDAPYKEPLAFGTMVPLDSVYVFDPAPEDMEGREKVIGVQTNLWTEKISEPSHAEYMLYPRVFALSEVAWSTCKDPSTFRKRALEFSDYWRADGYSCFNLSTEVGQRPQSTKLTRHKARGCKVEYVTMFESNYSAGGTGALTDGCLGTWAFNSGWQGFLNKDIVVTVDLGNTTRINSVGGDFCQWRTAWICMPVEVSVELSDDGSVFRKFGEIETGIDLTDENPMYRCFSVEGNDRARYVRFTARINEDKWGWLFMDELIVK